MSTDKQQPECTLQANERAGCTSTEPPAKPNNQPAKEQPTHTAYSMFKGEQGQDYFRRIGAGWEKPKGGVSIYIHDKRELELGRPFTLRRNQSPERGR